MKGIFYLTYNGYYNYTTGIGTQTKTILKGMEEYYKHYEEIFGEFHLNLIVPRFDNSVDGFDKNDIKYADKVIEEIGGKVYTCNSNLDKNECNFWSPNNWEKISRSAASIIVSQSKNYDKIIVIAIDPPFLHTPRYIENLKNDTISCHNNINSIIIFYTSSYIHDKKISYNKLGWEYSGFASARNYEKINIGNVCSYLSNHFIEYYGADRNSFVPYYSSLYLEDNDFNIMPKNIIINILKKNNIPTNCDIIFSFGRAAWVKGFDIFLENIKDINNICFVLIASPFEDITDDYQKYIKKHNINCILITKFTRDLPRALSQHTYSKIVVCPSRTEPFSNIPFEVSLWAKNKGPVVLASNVGGFTEQIEDEKNGFLFDIQSPITLTNKINYILKLPKKKLDEIRLSAYDKVVKERNFYNNFKMLLDLYW